MFRRFRGILISLVILASVLSGTVAYGHYLGTHKLHTHDENARNQVLHQHWNGCYMHTTYDHVDYTHHLDQDGYLVDHTYIGSTGSHLHESYWNFYYC